MVEIDQTKLLFDPFITGNEKASGIDVDKLNPDYILITHAHQDHILDVSRIAKNSEATLISNFEIINHFGDFDGMPLNHGGSVTLSSGIKVQYVNAIHTSSFPDGTYGGQPGGFVVSTEDIAFYHSGDTALTMDMKLIGEDRAMDFAMLCLGDNFTMGAKDATRAAHFVQTSRVIGMHFDTFPPIKIDHAATEKLFADAHLDLILPTIGQTIEI